MSWAVPPSQADFDVMNEAIVLDTGSGFTKAGFACDDAPRVVVPTLAGTVKSFAFKLGTV